MNKDVHCVQNLPPGYIQTERTREVLVTCYFIAAYSSLIILRSLAAPRNDCPQVYVWRIDVVIIAPAVSSTLHTIYCPSQSLPEVKSQSSLTSRTASLKQTVILDWNTNSSSPQKTAHPLCGRVCLNRGNIYWHQAGSRQWAARIVAVVIPV